MRTNVVEPNAVVRFAGQLWRVETRVGGVYQLRAFAADKVTLTSETRLAQRIQFTKLDDGSAGKHLTDKPTGDIKSHLHRAHVRVLDVPRDAAPSRFDRVDLGSLGAPYAAHVTDDFMSGVDAAD